MSRFDLTGEVAFVTGASAGLGRHIAATLAAAGAAVALAARRADLLDAVARDITDGGGRAVAVACDVTSAASIAAAVTQAEAALGPIGVLVNNSGIIDRTPVLEVAEAEWDRVLDVNLKGAFLTAQTVARRMAAAGRGGRIVNIASILGLTVRAGVASYATSKAALVQLTKLLGLELGPLGITVNAIAPGFIETDMTRDFLASDSGRKMIARIPLRRPGLPADLEGPLLLLASAAGQYLNGVVIPVDGGHLVSGL